MVAEYRKYFLPSGSFAVWDLSRDVVEKAAELRAKYRIKMLDALHIATAIVSQADLFVCNDLGLRRVTEIKILLLSDYAIVGSS